MANGHAIAYDSKIVRQRKLGVLSRFADVYQFITALAKRVIKRKLIRLTYEIT